MGRYRSVNGGPGSPDLARHYKSSSPLPTVQLHPQSPTAGKKHQAVQDLPPANTFVGAGDNISIGSDHCSEYSCQTNNKYSKQVRCIPHLLNYLRQGIFCKVLSSLLKLLVKILIAGNWCWCNSHTTYLVEAVYKRYTTIVCTLYQSLLSYRRKHSKWCFMLLLVFDNSNSSYIFLYPDKYVWMVWMASFNLKFFSFVLLSG